MAGHGFGFSPLGLLLAVPALIGSALPSAASSRRSSVTVTHVAETGQTLWSIAHAYGVGVEDLLRTNHIDDPADVLSGQELVIPRPQREPTWETVPPGAGTSGMGWPLHGQITSLYGPRHRAPHSGLDIAATPGTIIVAAAAGKVVRAGKPWGRYGKVVLIEHRDGLVTLYAHASRSFVAEGEIVRRGQAIAAVGRTGNATGPHLHFEVWSGDRTVDPLQYLPIPADLQTALFSR